MIQNFTTTADPSQGPSRLKALRGAMRDAGVNGFFVPRADTHMGEYVADCDARLAWLTGFTGSAGFAIALTDICGVFIDGRYRNQVKKQVDLAHFTPVHWPETGAADWLKEVAKPGDRVGFDPMLHAIGEVKTLREALKGSGIELVAVENLVDRVWEDRPPAPAGRIFEQTLEFAGLSHRDKIDALADELVQAGDKAAVITLSDSIAWLLNIRGDDLPRLPVVQGFAILHDDARVDFFTNPAREGGLPDHLGAEVALHPVAEFQAALAALKGPVRLDRASVPYAIAQGFADRGVKVNFTGDPTILPKAQKNPTEIAGARAAHLRDGAAVVEFLTWYDATAGKTELSEIDLVVELENARRATNQLRDISFETIAGTGPNGAVMHYRVTEETNAKLFTGQIVVLDSGGQYLDGTTDITRTLPVGDPAGIDPEIKACFTRVLQGMIAISRLRFPRGLAGRDIDALARAPLWNAHQDFNHGTGHGVGAYLSVHEGPQRISRASEVPLAEGMILSNEPGYYRDGAFGIRLENLIVTGAAKRPAGGDDRDMLCFETLTFVPIHTGLVVAEMLSSEERAWLNAYHAKVAEKIGPLVSDAAKDWLTRACAPI